MNTAASPSLYAPDLDHSGEIGTTVAYVRRTARDVVGLGTDLAATLRWVVSVGHRIAPPAAGATGDRWGALAACAEVDVSAARALEPHIDALGILSEARAADLVEQEGLRSLGIGHHSSWGVYAAEGKDRLRASCDAGGAWRLDGVKSWCSLAAELSHALVTAWVDENSRRLFAVSLRHASVHPHPGPWVARGLRGIVSAPVDFSGTPAVPVGGDDWYLHRPGFEWGGMGVAAAWWGGALPLLEALRDSASPERADQIAHWALGEADTASWAARSALSDAARRVDDSDSADSHKLLAARVRSIVAASTEAILRTVSHARGPGPLTTDESYARRVADLELYVRQHHAERDLARIGRLVVEA